MISYSNLCCDSLFRQQRFMDEIFDIGKALVMARKLQSVLTRNYLKRYSIEIDFFEDKVSVRKTEDLQLYILDFRFAIIA